MVEWADKVRLDKALEACRLMFAAHRLVRKSHELFWRDRSMAERLFGKAKEVEGRMFALAREALAEGSDGGVPDS